MVEDIQIGDIKFYDNYIPGIQGGNYTIQVAQNVDYIGITQDDQSKLSATQKFVVCAPQFSLDSADIHSMVPPNNSIGQFADELPHIVLSKPIIPWERTMNTDKPTPWIALMVFGEKELLADTLDNTDARTKAIRTTIEQYMAMKGSQDIFIPPIIEIEKDIDIKQTCYYIQMSSDTFKMIVPQLDELPYLAHIRQINSKDKPILGIQEEDLYSIVVANRFPKVASNISDEVKNIVHLVSLEKMEDYINQPGKIIQGKVALISLARWSFTCQTDNKEDFEGLMKELVADEKTGAAYAPDKLLLRLNLSDKATNDSDTMTEVKKRILYGYVPMPFHTRSGEDTFAWYRGPLSPINTAQLNKHQPFFSFDSALIYDEQYGMFDCSLSSAWQLGRNLALADSSFGKQLLAYRRKSCNIIDRMYENISMLGSYTVQDLKKLVNPGFNKYALLSLIGKNLTDTLSKTSDKSLSALTVKGIKNGQGQNKSSVVTLKQFICNAEVQQAVWDMTSDELQVLANWLALKQLLYDVPFNYFVPDNRILPVDSIRFFYIDQNWLDAMLDGMLSIAIQSSRDSANLIANSQAIKASVKDAMKVIRSSITGKDEDPDSNQINCMSGFLLRSSVVTGWPGLSVRAFDSQNNPLKILRLDHLSEGLLLGIFWGIPERIELSEPQEGFKFGINQDGEINLRCIQKDNPNYKIGSQLSPPYKVRPAHIRNGQVIDLRPNAEDGLIKVMSAELKDILKLNQLDLKPSDFALQMVKSPEKLMFKVKAD
jgi:hypothetical protein